MIAAYAESPAPVERLWSLVGDVTAWPQHVETFTSITPLSGDGGLRLGAQFAVRQAQCLAHNLRHAHLGRPTQAFAARSRGMMAATGRRNGVAEVFGLAFSGLPAWLLWRAYYLGQMPTLRRKLRVWVEWTWGMFFPPDITHLRFTRSVELQVEEGH